MIGIIKLDTQFQRIPGDIGNPDTWNCPVIYELMENIYPDKVVCHIDSEVLTAAIRAATNLQRRGARAVTTTCGFLSRFQSEIRQQVDVPVFTSSLLQIPLLYNLFNRSQQVGILTANSQTLSNQHLFGAGIRDIPLVIYGMENYPYFQKVFVENKIKVFDVHKIRSEIIQATRKLLRSNGPLGAIVLECTNMSPFIQDIYGIAEIPVFDICSLMSWVVSGFMKNKESQ